MYDLSVEHGDHSFIHESGVIVHNCAFVIANRPISEFIPLTSVSDVMVTAYTAPSVEAVGGLKMDFLGLGCLDDIGDAIQLIQSRYAHNVDMSQYRIIDHEENLVGWSGPPREKRFSIILNGRRVPSQRLLPMGDKFVDIWDLPGDQAVFADVATGKTETVFQFNTPGAVQWLEHFAYRKPNGNYAIDSIEAMSAFTALDRPGPLDIPVSNPDEPNKKHNMLVEYARRARGANPSPDVLQIFNELIPETYGVMVYQEQLQRVYQQLTGCSGSDAEEFRSNVAKKKKAKIEKAYKPFIEKAGAKIGKENAEAAWQFFITWAKYGFNKSHSVCYSVDGYACAYLKHHYPLEWWTAILRNADKTEIQEKFWRHCGQLIDLPDVKLSGENFEIQGTRIRAPLNLLHGVGDKAQAQLTAYAPYTDIDDFCRKIDLHRVRGGEWVTKLKTRKDTKNKYRNEEGKLVSPEITEEVATFKRGNSALNRGVVEKLILSGSMDSLFPPEMHLGEQLNDFERALAAAVNATNEELAKRPGAEKPKLVKPQTVDKAKWDLSRLKRFQIKKSILPAYSMDLLPEIRGATDFVEDTNDGPVINWQPPNSSRVIKLDVMSASEVERADRTTLAEDEMLQVAVAAYVESTRPFTWGDEKKEACEVVLDVAGARMQFVKWGGKAGVIPELFKGSLAGSIVFAVLTKFKTEKPFALDDLLVVQPSLEQSQKQTETKPEKEEEDEAGTEADVGSDPE